ncbi:MAG: hypothetical protein R3D90_07980 [Paracoccaceae bacterium]
MWAKVTRTDVAIAEARLAAAQSALRQRRAIFRWRMNAIAR